MSNASPPCILQVCAVDFTAYHFLRPLMEACAEQGWRVEFACAPGPDADALVGMGFRHRSIPVRRSRSPFAHVVAALALASGLRRNPVDLVHTHTPIGGLVGRAAAIVTGSRVVHTFHGLPFADPPSPTDRVFLAIERILAARTSYFFSQAGGDAQRAIALRIARAEDMLVIGNGVDTTRFGPDQGVRAEIRRELGVPDEAVLLVAVSRLVREKGLGEVADAVHSLASDPRLHVAIVGRALPSDRSDMTAELRVHPVVSALGPRWRMLGYRADVNRLLKGADVFVLASYREGLPRSVIEAMASGVAVVATAIPGCRELIDDGMTGLLVPPRDAPALAAALARLIREDGLRAEMGRRARKVALERLDERVVVGRQLPVLAGLVRS